MLVAKESRPRPNHPPELSGKLLFNTLWMAGGLTARPLLQAAYFVVLTRTLGPAEYGLFVAWCAVFAFASPFSGWGTGTLVIQRINQAARSYDRAIGSAMALTVVSGSCITAIVCALGALFASNALPTKILFVLALSDLLLFRLQDLCWQAYQAVEKLDRTSQIQFVQVLSRLVAATAFATFGQHGLTEWAMFYGAMAVVSTVIILALLLTELGIPRVIFKDVRDDLKDGSVFAIGLSSLNVYNDADKPIVAALAGASAAGVYGAAYRMIDVCFMPVRALLYSVHPQFFRAGRHGCQEAGELSEALLPKVLCGALLGALCALAGTLVVKPLLGAGYQDTAQALLILVPIPLFRALHYVAGDALTASGQQTLRSSLQFVSALLTVAVGLVVIRHYSWHGAAALSVGMEAFLALSMWIVLWKAAKPRYQVLPEAEQT